MDLNDLLTELEVKTGYKPKRSGKGYSARCPCRSHDDQKASLSIAETYEGKILMHCHAGCNFEAIRQELNIALNSSKIKDDHSPNEHYYYHNEKMNILYRKVKTPSKSFYFEKFQNETWMPGLEGVRRVIYHLPEVISAISDNKVIAIAEGEKDVDTLRKYGYIATTNDTGGGKNKWNKTHSKYLQNAHVILFFDYDQTGIDHRDNVIKQLKGYVSSLKVIHLPSYEVAVKNGKDISDWLKEGHTSAELKQIIEETEFTISPQKVSTSNAASNIINAISIETLLTMKMEPPEIFLDPFITKSSLGMIYAPRGIGKTFFALSVALAIASGTQFLKFKSLKPRKIVYLDGEMSLVSMRERLERIYNSQEVKPPEGYFQLVNPFLQEIPLPDLGSINEQKLLDPIIADADVIIVDNLSCWMTSGVENEGESWIPVQDWALRQRRKGKAVIFIHHANKNNRQRGTSRREDILDYVIKLDKPSDYKPKDGANFVLSFEKHRSWFGTDVESLQVKLIDKADGKRVWEWSAIEENFVDSEKLEIQRLHSQGKKQNEIAKELNVSTATVCRRLKNYGIS
jgi:5S rRNA maturation endonuclease (ribonuclease M5)/transcriptional regulator